MLFKLAWRNLWRNRTRTLITMASVFFAVVLSVVTVALQQGIWENLIKNVVSFYTGYAQIHQNGYWEEQILDNSFENSPTLNQQVLQQPLVNALAPRLESFALASSEKITKGSLVIGVDPQSENRITALQNKIIQGSYLLPSDTAVLMAQGLANKLQLQLHDTVILLGQGFHGATAAGKYAIKGIVKFGSPELNDAAVYLPLALAQELYSAPNRLTSLVVGIADPPHLQTVTANLKQALGNAYEVMSWKELMPEIVQHMRTDTGGTYITIAILYLLITFGIFGTLLMMVAERRFEFGMLMAIGMKRRLLMWIVLLESVFISIAGCIVGMLISIPVVYYLKIYPLRFSGEVAEVYSRFGFEPVFPTTTKSSVFIEQALVVLLIALVLSLYPLYKVKTLNEVEAMRR
ncbi:ABC transporter permease [Sphingobacteriales bacterium UPWRP_1]|nr:transporter [Sphingobacteriales bacterium TSM_CSM]PSJ73010.1 ABC transporter permease [Sphingobacteriales bacterium UPWRP_1]